MLDKDWFAPAEFKASGISTPKTQEEIIEEKFTKFQKDLEKLKEDTIVELGQVVKMAKTGKSKEEIMQEESTIKELEKNNNTLDKELQQCRKLITYLESELKKQKEKNRFTEFALLDKFNEWDYNDLLNAKIPPIIYLVYKYESEPYYGRGHMIVCTVGKKYYYKNLEHCSCYGPLDGALSETTLEEILCSDNIHDLDIDNDIRNKIKEIEGIK